MFTLLKISRGYANYKFSNETFHFYSKLFRGYFFVENVNVPISQFEQISYSEVIQI